MQNPLDPNGRLSAFGTQLIEIHDGLREELARLQDDVDDYLDDPTGPRPGPLHTVQAHCLAFCSALERHHTQEDDTTFDVLLDDNPGLRPVIEQLRRDHHIVSGMLRSIEALVGRIGPDLDAAGGRRVRAEVEGLAALMESHFTYEERKLVVALDALS